MPQAQRVTQSWWNSDQFCLFQQNVWPIPLTSKECVIFLITPEGILNNLTHSLSNFDQYRSFQKKFWPIPLTAVAAQSETIPSFSVCTHLWNFAMNLESSISQILNKLVILNTATEDEWMNAVN